MDAAEDAAAEAARIEEYRDFLTPDDGPLCAYTLQGIGLQSLFPTLESCAQDTLRIRKIRDALHREVVLHLRDAKAHKARSVPKRAAPKDETEADLRTLPGMEFQREDVLLLARARTEQWVRAQVEGGKKGGRPRHRRKAQGQQSIFAVYGPH